MARKYTNAQREEVLALVKAGCKVKDISELLSVPVSTIRGWVRKQPQQKQPQKQSQPKKQPQQKQPQPQEQVFLQEDPLEDVEVGFLFIHVFYNHRLTSLEHA